MRGVAGPASQPASGSCLPGAPSTYPEVLALFLHSAGTPCPDVLMTTKESPFVAGLTGSHLSSFIEENPNNAI